MQRLVYLRHAESTNNDLYARTGARDGRHPDPELTERGVAQANLLAATVARDLSLRDVPLWASPTARAVATAAAVHRAGTGCGIVLQPDLVEGGGIYERDVDDVRRAAPGRALDELSAIAGVPLRWAADEHASWTGGFEEHDAVPDRAARLLDAVRASGEPVLVLVGHEWLAQHVIRAALGLPAGNDAAMRGWFRVPNASITEIRLDGDEAELWRLGADEHLADVPSQVAPRLV